jgi:hypothetical protein
MLIRIALDLCCETLLASTFLSHQDLPRVVSTQATRRSWCPSKDAPAIDPAAVAAAVAAVAVAATCKPCAQAASPLLLAAA